MCIRDSISGSVNFSNEVALALGHDNPESKIHVSESFFTSTAGNQAYPANMVQGNQQSWEKTPENVGGYTSNPPGVSEDGNTPMYVGSVFKASFRPFISNNALTGQYGKTAAYATGHIYDSYGRTQNNMLYGELITGHPDGWANGGESGNYEMSSSIQVGGNWSYSGNKNQVGINVKTAISPNNTNIGNCRQRALRHIQFNNSVIDNIADVSTTWYQNTIESIRQGTISVDVDASAGNGGLAVIHAKNNSTGTYGASAGYGLWMQDYSKHYLSGYVGIKDQSPSYELDVTGTIRATQNIIAYSDARHKENVETVTDAIQIVNDLRGVRFNWTKKYQKEKEAGGYYKSKKINEDALEKRQVGLIAQEVQEVLPELVSEDGEGYLSVNYANLVAVLVEANKEQQKLIEDLQERVKRLESK